MTSKENKTIAQLFETAADTLEIQGVSWKPQAYRKAANVIRSLNQSIREIYEAEGKGGLQDIPGVGESLAEQIVEFLEHGKVNKLENIIKEVPKGVNELLKLEGVGPKKAKVLHEELGVQSVDDLEQAINDGRVRELEGFGKTTEENIQSAILTYRQGQGRFSLGEVYPLAQEMVDEMRSALGLGQDQIQYAGSLRRMEETIGDLDILVASNSPEQVMDYVTRMNDVQRIIASGKTKTSVVLDNNLQVDVRVVEPESFGPALQYFTGSKEHNVELRRLARKQGYKLSEYGLFNLSTEEKINSPTEKSLYQALGLTYIHPELRENRGELTASLEDRLPKLVELADIRGDLQMHTAYSDGQESVEEMVKALENLGYDYAAITDHSQSQRIAGGMSVGQLREQWARVEELAGTTSLTLLKGAEVDILDDGSLDYPDDVLAEADVIVASVHSGLRSSREAMTERIVRAIENGFVNILAHPTARLIGRREPIKFDFDRVFEAAKNSKVALEVNSDPSRLDLNDRIILEAQNYEVLFVVSTDAHFSGSLTNMRYGVAQARRGWLTKEQIINTWSKEDLLQFFQHN